MFLPDSSVRRAWLLTLASCLGACSPLKTFDRLVPKDAGGKRVATDIRYGEDPRQMLDIYAPVDVRGRSLPVIIFFYGGNWSSGTRSGYSFVGRALAANGFIAMVPDYRLVPSVRYPAFVEDGAAAVRWTKANVARYGGDPARVILMGHSAGAYIAAMLAFDERWLRSDRAIVRGFIGIAGPYDFAPFDVPASEAAFGAWPDPAETQPITWAGPGDPTSLLLVGDADETVRPRNSEHLAQKLSASRVSVRVIRYPDIGHVGMITSVARPFRGKAPVLSDAVDFARSVSIRPLPAPRSPQH